MNLVADLKARGLVEHSSADIEKILGEKRTVYFGIDPSSDSPQIGNLAGILLMRRLGEAGHKLIFIVGGGTGMIGDPREKGERSLLDTKTLKHNTLGIKKNLKRLLGDSSFKLVDNADWLLKIDLFHFLRDIGKHFTVNDLIKRETIKKRLTTPDESISFTEFTYALLQGYDYMVLNKKFGCDLQIGGSDQWTNILSGVELIRKKEGKEAFAFTLPLITDSSGKKFGKSEGNAVWVDPEKTSPYTFYQFWLNVPDDSVEKYLYVYTFMPIIEISALCELHKRNPGRREAQKILAKKVTEIVHGEEAARSAEAVSEAIFGGRELDTLSDKEKTLLLKEAPVTKVSRATLGDAWPVVEALVASGLSASKSDAKRLISGNGVSVNGETCDGPEATLSILDFPNGLALLRRGKQVAILAIEK